MAAAGGNMSLDVAYRQVLVDFFDDVNDFWWHHRLLLIKGEGSGEWIAATPTLSVQMLDLKQHRVVPLERNSRVSVEIQDHAFLFGALTAAELGELLKKARALSAAFGVQKKDVEEGRWIVADPSSIHFATVVPIEVLESDTECVIREATGLVRIDDDWVSMQKIADDDLESFQTSIWTGPGRDRRIACEVRVNGDRYVSEAVSFGHWKKVGVRVPLRSRRRIHRNSRPTSRDLLPLRSSLVSSFTVG